MTTGVSCLVSLQQRQKPDAQLPPYQTSCPADISGAARADSASFICHGRRSRAAPLLVLVHAHVFRLRALTKENVAEGAAANLAAKPVFVSHAKLHGAVSALLFRYRRGVLGQPSASAVSTPLSQLLVLPPAQLSPPSPGTQAPTARQR
jgi:hypothetical protein